MITVLGSINVDLVARADRLPRPGETVAGRSAKTEAGGKGANQALAVHLAGHPVRLIGAVGNDAFAAPALDVLKAAGLDVSGVREVDGPTGSAFILIGDDGENMITVVPGANGSLVEADLERCFAPMRSGDVLMLQMEIPAGLIEQSLNIARARGIKTILNIAPATDDIRRLSNLADVVVANETEFELLVGEGLPSAHERILALRRLHEQNHQVVVVTLGAEGVIAIADNEIFHAKALSIRPIDTVGAGDTFCGYVAAGIARGDDFGGVLREAAVAGSLACTRTGSQTAIPERAMVLERH